MKRPVIAGVLVSIYVFCCGFYQPTVRTSNKAIEGETREKALIGLPYAVARQRILAEGWKISRGSCFAPKAVCRRYPEVGYCADVPKNPCGMVFEKPKNCLILTTNGDTFPGLNDHDPYVSDVSFTTSKC